MLQNISQYVNSPRCDPAEVALAIMLWGSAGSEGQGLQHLVMVLFLESGFVDRGGINSHLACVVPWQGPSGLPLGCTCLLSLREISHLSRDDGRAIVSSSLLLALIVLVMMWPSV